MSFSTLLSNTNGFDDVFLSLSRLSKQKKQAENPLLKIETEETKEKLSVFEVEEAPADMSSVMEAGMEDLTLGEGSSKEDWKNLFSKCTEAHEIILDSIDLESALACRLVCKDWRVTVNYYKNLWAKINKVFSIAVNL